MTVARGGVDVRKRVDATLPRVRQHHQVLTRDALAGFFEDQRHAVIVLRREVGPNWDDKLRALIVKRNTATARDIARRVAKAYGVDFDVAILDGWIDNNARIAAEGINAGTRDRLSNMADDEGRHKVFESLVIGTAVNAAREFVTRTSNFAAHDVAATVDGATKTWVWSGKGSRHSDIGGETVPVSENFSNGMAWPGDPTGGADENADCACSIEFGG